jgi:hypothetical protein
MRGNFDRHRWLIQELTKALNGSVRQEEYVALLAALSRCRDLLEKVAPELSKKMEIHGEVLMYLNILNGIVEDIKDYPTSYITSDDWKGAENHLKKKGVIK